MFEQRRARLAGFSSAQIDAIHHWFSGLAKFAVDGSDIRLLPVHTKLGTTVESGS